MYVYPYQDDPIYINMPRETYHQLNLNFGKYMAIYYRQGVMFKSDMQDVFKAVIHEANQLDDTMILTGRVSVAPINNTNYSPLNRHVRRVQNYRGLVIYIHQTADHTNKCNVTIYVPDKIQ